MPPIRIVTAVILDDAGRVLVVRKHGSDTFIQPGGKREPGEDALHTLARELHEELGLDIDPAAVQRWREQLVDYPHALVRLHFCKLFDWRGELQMREGQAFVWDTLPVQAAPVLPGALPVLEWLQAERGVAPDGI